MNAGGTTTKDFSLSSLVEELWEAERIEDVNDLTRKVIASIPADHMEDVMFRAVKHDVRAALRRIRHGVDEDRREHDNATRNDALFPAKPAAGRSRWLDTAGIYKRMLSQPETVGDNLVKPLGDLTREEVLAAAQRRMNVAKSNFAIAKRYEALADAMAERQASIVGDLDQPTLMAVFS